MAEIDANVLQRQSIQHDLHFIVKVAPEHGEWADRESYSHIRIDKRLDSHGELQMLADFYAQPGAYIVAIIAYDATTGQRNLSFGRVQVEGSGRDRFSEFLSGLPKIEFLPPPDNTAPLGDEQVLLPLRTQRSIQLDLIVDLSTQEEIEGDSRFYPYPGPAGSDSRASRSSKMAAAETNEQALLLQIASMLAAIDLQPGCTQVSALDALRRRTVLPPTVANQVDWLNLRHAILSPDKAMVSVADLKGKRETARFFAEQVEQRMAQPPACKLSSANPLHVVAIVSRGINFPSGSEKPRIPPGCNCKFFYLQETGRFIGGGDDLKSMLKPLSPTLLQFSDPENFREKFLEFTQTVARLP
ncbi:MAG TPA: hypothetical protein VK699_18560 [Terriglobales bacterium]|nr:hypothetical protein [Terriglobales bacterium]